MGCVQYICIVKVNEAGHILTRVVVRDVAILFKHLHISLRDTYNSFVTLPNTIVQHIVVQARLYNHTDIRTSLSLCLSPDRSLRFCHRSACCRRPVPSTTCPITPGSLPGCRDTSCSLTRRGELKMVFYHISSYNIAVSQAEAAASSIKVLLRNLKYAW